MFEVKQIRKGTCTQICPFFLTLIHKEAVQTVPLPLLTPGPQANWWERCFYIKDFFFFNSNIPSLLMCRISTGHRVPKSHLLHWIDHFLSTLTCFFFCLSFSLLFWSSSPGRQEFDQKVKQNLIKGRKWSRSIYFCIQTEYRLQVPPFDLLSQMEQYCKLQTTGT